MWAVQEDQERIEEFMRDPKRVEHETYVAEFEDAVQGGVWEAEDFTRQKKAIDKILAEYYLQASVNAVRSDKVSLIMREEADKTKLSQLHVLLNEAGNNCDPEQ